ncbi:hypothetical protein DPMN_163116 [Dreissena polymorpha]|uniref:Uncharacterized protein n=1 Tax=Dreissena polymorpha TaxID=45954 RepID=A0A9D4ESV9_DREPO|nr:hypothetical protein DPMN_163116 [Dreissena polymorpha]
MMQYLYVTYLWEICLFYLVETCAEETHKRQKGDNAWMCSMEKIQYMFMGDNPWMCEREKLLP